MLSILIPTYNYDVFPLVEELHKQCISIDKLTFEIIVLDDGSELFHNENNQINTLKHCSYSILEKNIGRSAIRNLLAKTATFEHLLFLDADVRTISTEFISNYLTFITNKNKYEVVYGGIVYQFKQPEKNQMLRWVYGINREALSAEKRTINAHISFLTLNFLIKKSVFEKVCFNENIPNLRYEDLLFSYHLKQNNISVLHINNQVIHNGIETSEIFLQKTQDSLSGLKYLLNHDILPTDYAKISKTYQFIKQKKLLFFIDIFYRLTHKKLRKNLLSKKPSLFVYDMYRLGYFNTLNK